METPDTPAPQPKTGADVNNAAPVTSSGWMVRNGSTIAFSVLALTAVGYFVGKAEEPLLALTNLAKVVLGLGLVIFIHELGHFLAAKWCDVHVETFSIGFGPPLFGVCQFKRGETTYKLAWIPLGGYVKMLGENPEDENADLNPRSYKNKSVGARMLIISAGVIMNVLLAIVLFLTVYLTHGVRQNPGIVGNTNPGGAGWQLGLRRGDYIRQIGSRKNPYYEDISRAVMATKRDQALPLIFDTYDGISQKRIETEIVPLRHEKIPIPMIGVSSAYLPVLVDKMPQFSGPCDAGSVSADAQPPFEFGDRIVGCSNPDNPAEIKLLGSDPRHNDPNRGDHVELIRRIERLSGKDMTFRVERGASTLDIRVKRALSVTLGLRMKMGQVIAIRQKSPAANAGLKPKRGDEKGDVISAVEFTAADGQRRRYSATPNGTELPLDPVKLPMQLAVWAESKPPNYELDVTVLRAEGHEGMKPVVLKMTWQKEWELFDNEPFRPDEPMSIAPLGIAYRVQNVIEGIDADSPAAGSKLKPNDAITAIQFKWLSPKGKDKSASRDLKDDQWAYYWSFMQETRQIQEVVISIGKEKVTLKPVADPGTPRTDRGLNFAPDVHLQKADGVGNAFVLSGRRLVDKMTMIYENLLNLILLRLSPEAISGPITIAVASYDFAGRDIFEFILFLALININLAVVNFLPIPVLDGGHMVFLVYEWLRGKPPSEKVRYVATFIGLAFILCLMAWGIYLDIQRFIIS